jgi:polyhydroxybutyrate depolymerase
LGIVPLFSSSRGQPNPRDLAANRFPLLLEVGARQEHDLASHHPFTRAVRFLAIGLVPSALAACSSSDNPAARPDSAGLAGANGVAASGAGGQSAPGGEMAAADMPAPGAGLGGAAGVVPSEPPSSEVVQPTGLAGAGGTEAGGSGSDTSDGDTNGGDNAPCAASATLQPGDTPRTLTIDGAERSYLVHAPPGYDGTTRVPVVFDFHGLGGNSNQQKNLSRWDDVADANGFITVYPQGIDNAWNAGLCCGDGGDDVAFVRAIIEELTADACIDRRRIFSSGCSNGGGMSYKLACEAADVIAAVAPVDFDCVDGAGCGDCAPSRPVSVVQFRGTNDQAVPYDGNGPFAGAQANLATWGEINSCSGSAAALAQNDACEALPMCGDGAQTVLCTVQGGTHCGSYGSFSIAEVAWAVLQNQALPSAGP